MLGASLWDVWNNAGQVYEMIILLLLHSPLAREFDPLRILPVTQVMIGFENQ